MIQHLPSMCKAMGSNPVLIKQEVRDTHMHTHTSTVVKKNRERGKEEW